MSRKEDIQNIIALDLRAASLDRGGIGRYTIGMTSALLRYSEEHPVQIGFQLYTAKGGWDFTQFQGDRVRIDGRWNWCTNGILRNGLLLPLSSATGSYKLLHSFDYLGPYTFFTRKLIISVHDLIPIHFPELATIRHRFVARCLLPRSLHLADAIIVQSNYVAEEVRERFPRASGKIYIVPPGIESYFAPSSDETIQQIRKIYGLPQRYLLFLKVDDPKKNIRGAVRALKSILECREFADISLAICGNPHPELPAEINSIINPFEKNLVWLGFVPEDHLPALYSGALALLFPSICEGFGYPILEAMACGCPVITSNLTSMPEVSGNRALCIDPTNADEMAHALLQVVENDQLRKELRAGGLEWSQQFTWEKSAARIVELYSELL